MLVLLAGVCLWGGGLAAQQPMPPLPLPDMAGAALQDTAPGQPVADQVAPEQSGDTNSPVSRMRDPFWPVGYTPKVASKPTVNKAGQTVSIAVVTPPEPVHVPQWDEAMRKIDIRGISLIGRDKDSGQPKYLAMVAGKLVEEGNVVSVTYNEFVYRWKVVGIGTAGVSFQKMDVRKE
jgi:hypothetical protein